MNTTQTTRRKAKQEPPLTVSMEEAARLLGISRTSMYARARESREESDKSGILTIKYGGRRLVPRAELERIVAGR